MYKYLRPQLLILPRKLLSHYPPNLHIQVANKTQWCVCACVCLCVCVCVRVRVRVRVRVCVCVLYFSLPSSPLLTGTRALLLFLHLHLLLLPHNSVHSVHIIFGSVYLWGWGEAGLLRARVLRPFSPGGALVGAPSGPGTTLLLLGGA